jgi:phenylalanyl-tRNA synthetase alpha chain
MELKRLKSLFWLTNLASMNRSNSDIPLHALEKSLLKAFAGNKKQSIEDLVNGTHLGIDQVRRAVEWLRLKGLVQVNETVSLSLGSRGHQAAKEGLPERKLVEFLKQGKNQIKEIWKSGFFLQKESHSAFRCAKQNNWIGQQRDSHGEKILVLMKAADDKSAEEKLLEKLATLENLKMSGLTSEEMDALSRLKSRDPDYVKEHKLTKETTITLTELGTKLLSSHGEDLMADLAEDEKTKSPNSISLKPDRLNVQAPTRLLSPGRKHPLVDLIDEVSEIFVGLGFSEIEGHVTQSSFWNFDALFVPQDHPAREIQDTFYVSHIAEDRFASDRQIRSVSAAHKKGWKYEWNIAEAKKLVLRTHTTAVTIKYLADHRPENARIFSIGRVFRNEKVSYKHLAEFTQIEGIITGSGVTIQDLIGLQLEFHKKLGITNVKFWPTFFPYTEPSLQSMIYSETLGKWVELFGMGVFRSQVTKTLGLKNPVLAWGGGLERIAMLRLGLGDLRDFYHNKLGWLRSTPRCQL